ncbi:UTP--glucose-1-phosphate uridylyltransferase [Mesomycoplasma neurolyticum]|uniref:UTP--glucose-1-phosphate uridylyltransferase n=2 Tax=Mesomycoplasma neurolyticum TaxID=2120 RepID=A0A449A5K3_9BACT|nr:UTP--glucose-1-phosphate uridylyltransferase [Mesomycoplasma neurolyticum]VEU59541.1 UTP--glucose-1-phosphate uridylyltransferase [Mesomycoplasma neurolyticum]
MKINKVIIPAAGWGTRFLPLTKSIHKELVPILNKPAISYLVEECIEAGISEIILIISPRKNEVVDYFKIYELLEEELKQKNKIHLLDLVKKTNKEKFIKVVYQNEQLGLGHAIAIAAEAINNEPFGIILGDDLIYNDKKAAIKQLIEQFEQKQSSIIGVANVDAKEVNKYGIVVPKNESEKNNKVFEIIGAVEKPSIETAPSNKAIIGRYVFTPEILDLLKNLKPTVNNEIQLVDAFDGLIKKQKIYAYQLDGIRYDLGSIDGFVKANIDYALRDKNIKTSILEHIKKIR